MGITFSIRAGERCRVLWIFSSSIPGQTRFTAEPTDGGELTGTVELVRRRWFQFETETFPLQHQNSFDKGFADADYRIYVTPDQDCRIMFETRHFRAGTLFGLLIGLMIFGIVAAAASLFLVAG
ncbi:MAG: hypothetical protein AAFN51_10715 [Pseudomonadota bacterium]